MRGTATSHHCHCSGGGGGWFHEGLHHDVGFRCHGGGGGA